MPSVSSPNPKDVYGSPRTQASVHNPALATAASAVRAAPPAPPASLTYPLPSSRHVARGALVSIQGPSAQPLIYITLFDGGIGGTILSQIAVQFPAASVGFDMYIPFPDLQGSPNVAMTLATTNLAGAAAAPAAGNGANLSLFTTTVVD